MMRGLRLGDRRGRLEALSSAGKGLWRFRCDCGQTVVRLAGNVQNGKTKSCGCLAAEVVPALKHGHASGSYSRTYTAWANAKKRCYCPSSPRFEAVGGRGIRMCDAWKSSFEAFLEDMGEAPEGCQLSRSDSEVDYRPGNCVWKPRAGRAREKRGFFVGALDALNEREAEILAARFLAKGDKVATFQELGIRFGITGERVRQLEKVALRKVQATESGDRSLSKILSSARKSRR